MMLTVLIAASYVAYAAPTHDEAYSSYTARVLEAWREKGAITQMERIRKEPYFPTDISIERCERRRDREVIRPSGEFARVAGYECIMEIWPNSAPSFRSPGFFYHDGVEWIYFGAIHETPTPSLSEFNPLRDEGAFILKEGAQGYDGAPRNPYYDNYDPYGRLFDLSEQYDTPNY